MSTVVAGHGVPPEMDSSFQEGHNACGVRTDGDHFGCSGVGQGLRQVCVLSPLQFTVLVAVPTVDLYDFTPTMDVRRVIDLLHLDKDLTPGGRGPKRGSVCGGDEGSVACHHQISTREWWYL